MTEARLSTGRSAALALTMLMLVAVGVRVAACWYWAADLTYDRDAYLGIAQQLAAGHGFCTPGTTQPTAYRPPLLPWLLAGGLLVVPPAWATAAVNLVCGAVTVLVTWWVAQQLYGSSWPSWLAASLVAVDPLLLRYTAQPMTECLFAALTVTVVGLLWRASQTPSRGTWWGWAGVVSGLGALCRPTIWPFLLFVSLAWVVRHRKAPGTLIPSLGTFWLGLLVTVSPWVLRNAWVLGYPILTTTHGGYTLLLANNPVFYAEVARQPWGTVWEGASLARWQADMLAEMERELGPALGEVASDRWQTQRAWKFLREDVPGFLHGVLYRLRSFWSLTPRGEHARQVPHRQNRLAPVVFDRVIPQFVTAWYAVFLGGAAWGLIQIVRSRGWWSCVLWLGLVGSVQLVHLLYWTDTRMRAPLHPLLAVCAAGVWRGRTAPAGGGKVPESSTTMLAGEGLPAGHQAVGGGGRPQQKSGSGEGTIHEIQNQIS